MKRNHYWGRRDEFILAVLEVAYYVATFRMLLWAFGTEGVTLGQFLGAAAGNFVTWAVVDFLGRVNPGERCKAEKIILTGMSFMLLVAEIILQAPVVFLLQGLAGCRRLAITRARQFAHCEARRYGHPKTAEEREVQA